MILDAIDKHWWRDTIREDTQKNRSHFPIVNYFIFYGIVKKLKYDILNKMIKVLAGRETCSVTLLYYLSYIQFDSD